MKKASFLSTFFLFSVYLLSGTALYGQTLLVEDFNYASGQLLTANGWTAHSAGGTNAITVSDPGLTYSGYPSSGVGRSVALTTSGEDDNKTFTVQTSGTVYASFMVNISDAAADPIGGYFIHLGPDPISTTFRGRVFIKKDASNNIAFGITKASTSTATDIAYTPFSYSLNTTYLLVIKYTIVAGTANDTVSLYINPALPGSEPGSATITAPDVAGGDINPGSVALRQGTASTSPTVRVDGIRIGTSWAGVTDTPVPPDANVDMNGDGTTDYVVVRMTGTAVVGDAKDPSGMIPSVRQRMRSRAAKKQSTTSPSNAPAYWYTLFNGTANYNVVQWGDAEQDVFITGDFDGDTKDDVAVWRPGDPISTFYILNSFDSTFSIAYLGDSFSDPSVTGDYDGDGKADPAVYSCPLGSAGNCYYSYIGSKDNPDHITTAVQWGVGDGTQAGNPSPAPGDYDGDRKYDFCVQRQVPGGNPGSAEFVILRSTDLGSEQIQWGVTADTIEPGDYDGDGKADITVVRNIGGTMRHFILFRTGSAAVVDWGTTGDIPVPGDYDGDGRTDIAVFRPVAPSGGTTFFSLNVQNGSYGVVQWGACSAGFPCDFPVANWNVQ